MIDNPEIPEPEKAPPEEKTPLADRPQPDPHMNGNGSEGSPQISLDQERLIKWMQATDKELKILQLTQFILCAAIITLIATRVKPQSIPKAP
jgi:hypothetical protein